VNCRAAPAARPYNLQMPLALTCLVVLLALVPAPTAAQSAPARPSAARGLTDLSQSLQDLAERVSPSVVQVFVTGYAEPDEEDQAASEPVLERSSGSGVIVDAEGYIITNAHVVERATRIEVELPLAATGASAGASVLRRRGRVVGAQIVAIDHETDVAVIKVEAKGLPVLAFGDSEALRPGQIVLAFGSPLGLESSVTLGVVSAVARQLTPEDPMIYIQTDAPINPGNSGGALVDTEGKLVGISTLIYSQSGGNEGIGFAAPSNIVRNVFLQIRKTGRVRRGDIGVRTQTITPTLAEALGVTSDAGVILSDVTPSGPAARAGLQPGDLVLALDGKRMENGRQLRINLYARGVNDTVVIDVLRGDRKVSVRVPVGERETDVGRLRDLIAQQIPVRALGVTTLNLTPEIVQLLPNLRRQKGVIVASVSQYTPYSQQGRLQPGDVIYTLNGKPVESAADLNALTSQLKAGIPTVLHLEREGALMYLAFKLEGPR
jgi:serine protease Do